MSKKSAKIAALIAECQGRELSAHYLGYFECFNRGFFYEAHDVLEELWLADRQGPEYSYFKGLIQFAGAFVHLQKNRLRPAAALFKLARTNLQKYPPAHLQLNLAVVLDHIEDWLHRLESADFAINPFNGSNAPVLRLLPEAKAATRTTLILATRNEHKAGEIRGLLSGRFQILTLREFPGAPPVIEDANTFADNAAKKAEQLARWLAGDSAATARLGAPAYVLADDSGLEVDALNGAPGVYSARFAAADGESGNSSDADNNAKLMRLLKEVPTGRRSARFRCVLALTPVIQNSADKSSSGAVAIELFDGVCEGQIAPSPSGGGGFGYDPLFIPWGETCTFAELGEAAKNRISHRAKALEKLQRRFAMG